MFLADELLGDIMRVDEVFFAASRLSFATGGAGSSTLIDESSMDAMSKFVL